MNEALQTSALLSQKQDLASKQRMSYDKYFLVIEYFPAKY